MDEEANRLRSTLAAMPDSELLKIASVDCGRYPTPTLLGAIEELLRRGVPLPRGVSPPRPSPAGAATGASTVEAGGIAEPPIRYGGFWRRFGAYWLDLLFLIPVVAVSFFLSGTTRYYYAWVILPNLLIGLWYHVYLVRQFGGTPGKLVLGLRIRRTDGGPVGYREALLRVLVDQGLSVIVSVALAISAIRMSDGEYQSTAFLLRAQKLIAQAPAWYRPTNVLLQLWVWGEFIVMLTNRKRRALHDFLAGTVVLYDPPALRKAPAPAAGLVPEGAPHVSN